jgi:photoactive yellow protein
MSDEPFAMPSRSALPAFDALKVPSLSDAELDALPFGVICLDAEGVVLRYNLAESRLARLDRAQVVGKNFYRRVAPCTATNEFEGRVRAFLTNGPPIGRFSYVFDFKFGAQQVDVELVRVPGNERVYLLINRTKFAAPRAGLPMGFAAPLQAELAPREFDLGVLRDASARRVLSVNTSFFTALHQTWLKVAPKAWAGFSREWGWQWGRHAVVDLEADLLEERLVTLREVSMRDAMERVSHWAVARGLGTLRFDFRPAKGGAFVVTLERSAVGEAAWASGTSSCALIEGLLEAVCEHLSNRLLAVREAQCCAAGFGACSFVVVSELRREPLERACAEGKDLPQVLEALRGDA